MERMRIGELAEKVQLSPKTIRYYELIGLVPAPGRGENAYRLYSTAAVDRLRFIRRAKALGLSLEEIREIASYALDGHCVTLQSHLQDLLQAKLAETESRIAELTLFKEQLEGFCRELSGDSPRKLITQGPPSSSGAACACLDQGDKGGDPAQSRSGLTL